MFEKLNAWKMPAALIAPALALTFGAPAVLGQEPGGNAGAENDEEGSRARVHLVGHHQGLQGAALTDFNGDGLLDVVAASPEAGVITVFFQGESGGWTQRVLAEGLPRPERVALADLNGDDVLDVITSCQEPYVIGLLQSEEENTPWQRVDLADSLSARQPVEVLTTDLDQDGDMDVLYADGSEEEAGGIYWLENLSPVRAFLTDAWKAHKLATLPGVRAMRLVELTEDNRFEVFCSAGAPLDILLWLERSSEDPRNRWKVHEVSKWPDPRAVTLANLDADQDALDLIAGKHPEEAETATVEWMRYAAERWQEQGEIDEETSRPVEILTLNIDEDKTQEVFVATREPDGQSTLRLYDYKLEQNAPATSGAPAKEVWREILLHDDLGLVGQMLRAELNGKPGLELITIHGEGGVEEFSNCVRYWEF